MKDGIIFDVKMVSEFYVNNWSFCCSDDHSAIARVNNYLASGSIMRQECLSHANLPCEPLAKEMHGEPWYEVEKTGALVTLSSSTALLHYYCSRLPSDRFDLVNGINHFLDLQVYDFMLM